MIHSAIRRILVAGLRFSTSDEDRLRSLTQSLRSYRLDGAPLFASWIEELKAALGLQKGLIYGLRREAVGLSLSFAFSAGMRIGQEQSRAELDAMVRTAPGRWGIYDPERPEVVQRNRAFAFPPVEVFIEQLQRKEDLALAYGVETREAATDALVGFRHCAHYFRRAGIDKDFQLRALVCDGGSLLAWVGGMCAEEPSANHRRLLDALVPALTDRLRFENQLNTSRLAAAALGEALESLSRPAFLVRVNGAVELANTAGQALLAHNPSLMREELAEIARGRSRPEGYACRPVQAPGMADHLLVLGPVRQTKLDKLADASHAWRLSPRQRQVLERVLRGQSNKLIASDLQCSERTVEVHLTGLFRKAGVQSRSELTARYWLDG